MNKKNRSNVLVIVIICMTAIVIGTLAFFLKGSTTTTGNYPEAKHSPSLKCDSTKIAYPIFTYDNSQSKSLTITSIYSQNKIASISLIYKLWYPNEETLMHSRAINHAEMNNSFSGDGLRADSYNAKYANLDNSLQMILYAQGEEINIPASKYFMIDNELNDKSIEDLKASYEKQGFNCQIIN